MKLIVEGQERNTNSHLHCAQIKNNTNCILYLAPAEYPKSLARSMKTLYELEIYTYLISSAHYAIGILTHAMFSSKGIIKYHLVIRLVFDLEGYSIL